jgi:hypothetical protein
MKNLKLVLGCFVLMAVSAAPLTAFAVAYKWTDQSGEVHYSSHPPSNTAYEIIDTKEGYPGARKGNPPSSESTPPADSSESSSNSTESGKKLTNKEKLEQNCKTIKEDLEKLESNSRVKVKEGGATRVLEEEERQKMIEERRKWLSDNCD